MVIDDFRNEILSLVLFITGAKAENTFEDDAFIIKSTEAIEAKGSDTEPVCYTAGVLLLKTGFGLKLPSQLCHIVRAVLFVMLLAMFVDIYVRN